MTAANHAMAYVGSKSMRSMCLQSWMPFFHALSAFILSRCIIILAGYLGLLFNISKMDENIFKLFCKWDCGWYIPLIEYGYNTSPSNQYLVANQANWTFFPAFPLAARLVSTIFSISALSAAYIVSNISFLFMLVLFYKYALLTLSKNQTLFATYLFALFPYSFYFSIPYTEGLFSLLLIAVYYFAMTNRWLIAAVAAAILSATRNIGVFVTIPMLIIAVQQFGFNKLIRLEGNSIKATFAILIAPLGLFIYMFFLYLHIGDPLAFFHVKIAWGRTDGNPLKHLLIGLFSFRLPEAYFAGYAIACLLCGLIMLKLKRYSEGTWVLIAVLIPASTGLWSLPRYCIAAFPIYLFLALTARNNLVRYSVFVSAILLNSLLVLAWIAGRNFMV